MATNNQDKLHTLNVSELIPQKAPFVMVDKLLSFSEEEITAGITVEANNIFVKNNIFTEPGLIEHMAQSVALHTGCQYKLKNEPAPVGYIGSVKSVEIHQLPKLNDELVTKVTILHEIMGVTLVNISVSLHNKEIAKGQMKTVIAN